MTLVRPDENTVGQINEVVDRLLFQARVFAPPVPLPRLLSILETSHQFLDLTSRDLVESFASRVQVEGRVLADWLPRLRLEGLWLPDEAKILVELKLPPPKRNWALFHELAHRALPWHREFCLGDTAKSLDPSFRDVLEAEANYCASALLFCGSQFESEARTASPAWSTVTRLAKTYNASLVTALRRFVTDGPDYPMIGIVSTPWWKELPDAQEHRCRHVALSPRFKSLIGTVERDVLDACISANTTKRKGGPVGQYHATIVGDGGHTHRLRCETFFNSHDFLTLMVHESTQRPSLRLVKRNVANRWAN